MTDPWGVHYHPQSTFTMSYNVLNDLGFWDPQYIAEDCHVYLKALFERSGNFEMQYIPLPVTGMSLNEESYLYTHYARFADFLSY